MEKMPPPPGFFFSGVAKMAFVLWNAIGILSRTLKNCVLAVSEKPFTSWVTWRISVCSGVPVFFATVSRMSSRVRRSISGTSPSIFLRSDGSST